MWHMGPYKCESGSRAENGLTRSPAGREFRDFYRFNQPEQLGHINVETEVECGKRSQGEP